MHKVAQKRDVGNFSSGVRQGSHKVHEAIVLRQVCVLSVTLTTISLKSVPRRNLTIGTF